ncbi:hypothetical protein ACN4EK_24485 [Pantanalinema rosaneae CENA516]|uniref:hypothetical protein n=1 Tax=Pantanalinema rosaneae TaxID=1620701 RepID=UPI003D6FACB6
MTVYATTNQPTVAKSSGFVQIPVELITYVRSLNLTGTQYDLWLYLFSLDPYGDRFIAVPSPKEIAAILQVDYRTVERAAQRLADCHLFEFQIEQWKARNRKPLLKTVLPAEQFAAAPSLEPLPSQDSQPLPQFSLGKEIQILPDRSNYHQTDPNSENGISLVRENQILNLEAALSQGFNDGHVPNKENTLLKEQTGVSTPTHHPVQTAIDKEVFGTAELLERIQIAGVTPNKTIQKAIGDLQKKLTPPEVVQAVENAISALREQQAKGIVHNPGGFLVAALRRKFTANQAKRQARQRGKQASVGSSPQTEPLTNPAFSTTSDLSDLSSSPQSSDCLEREPSPDPIRVSLAIDQALLNHDREFALNKLRSLWTAGWHSVVEELLLLRQEWGFRIAGLEVCDRSNC